MPTHDELTQSLIDDGYLRTPAVIDAWRAVDRAAFMPAVVRDRAYDNVPQPIGHRQTISQPLTVAVMLELLKPQPGERCLDVGAGSGWVSALLGQLVGPRGSVIGVERIPFLARRAEENVRPFNLPQVRIVVGDASAGWPPPSAEPRSGRWPDGAPYDIIHVAAAAAEIPPAMKEQLAVGGRLLIPVGTYMQDLVLITRTGESSFTERRLPGFQFVPLVSDQPEVK